MNWDFLESNNNNKKEIDAGSFHKVITQPLELALYSAHCVSEILHLINIREGSTHSTCDLMDLSSLSSLGYVEVKYPGEVDEECLDPSQDT